MPEINDIIETSDPSPLFLWWQWALVGIGVCLFLYLLSFLLKRKKGQPRLPSHSNLDLALQQLTALDSSKNDSNRLAVHLSLIVRKFIQRSFGDTALFETDEEFHARSTELERFSPEATEQLKNYLTAVADHKYAPNPNHPAALESLIENAELLLRNLDSIDLSAPQVTTQAS
ncbi:DUF4381 family protein [Rubritalea profundi]|uniref:DUF4129 domain-containing protein n=1 Tax=Rubritalea profundi TaxID=1658618 RepID=A0A2S7TZM2_9BACT|nr:DUF4381 family protein [Rubritalea profundi]PQJ27707.1 hypothetical protein BSZ32_03795 [Rubritalea profundi]